MKMFSDKLQPPQTFIYFIENSILMIHIYI